jgi:hypothetical protein
VLVKRRGARGATLVNPLVALPAKKLGDLLLLLLLRLGENGVPLFCPLADLVYHQRASLGNLHPLHTLGESGATDGKESTIKWYVPYQIGFCVHRRYADMYWGIDHQLYYHSLRNDLALVSCSDAVQAVVVTMIYEDTATTS